MAQQGDKSAQNGQVTSRTWTLLMTGGFPFQLKLPMNPLLEHDGTRTVWKMFGTLDEIHTVIQVIKDLSEVSISIFTETQTTEQRKERMDLLGLAGALSVESL